MIRTLFKMLFQDYIDRQIDQRFTENLIEKYWEQKQNETARRLQRARDRHKINYPDSYKELHSPEPKVLSSGNFRREDTKSRVQSKTTLSTLKDKLK